jgi:hypothetical protein
VLPVWIRILTLEDNSVFLALQTLSCTNKAATTAQTARPTASAVNAINRAHQVRQQFQFIPSYSELWLASPWSVFSSSSSIIASAGISHLCESMQSTSHLMLSYQRLPKSSGPRRRRPSIQLKIVQFVWRAACPWRLNAGIYIIPNAYGSGALKGSFPALFARAKTWSPSTYTAVNAVQVSFKFAFSLFLKR